mmetsp:Transcript_50140/g.79411  ORF Transcript_50140/g.79411 Transcript_50140/m.79411 type:complete len:208 (-) Transcript_50140:563-1186(-)
MGCLRAALPSAEGRNWWYCICDARGLARLHVLSCLEYDFSREVWPRRQRAASACDAYDEPVCERQGHKDHFTAAIDPSTSILTVIDPSFRIAACFAISHKPQIATSFRFIKPRKLWKPCSCEFGYPDDCFFGTFSAQYRSYFNVAASAHESAFSLSQRATFMPHYRDAIGRSPVWHTIVGDQQVDEAWMWRAYGGGPFNQSFVARGG